MADGGDPETFELQADEGRSFDATNSITVRLSEGNTAQRHRERRRLRLPRQDRRTVAGHLQLRRALAAGRLTPPVRAEIVAVGTELLIGQIANTNARWMSERLAELGVDVLHHQVVGDNADGSSRRSPSRASRADVVIVTGGLGPTQDDVTRPALAQAAGARLVRHAEIEDTLRDRFRVRGRDMPESNLAQADVPEGGRSITPERGTAPGLVVSIGGATVYAIPGVPSEMREMMEGTILPELSALAGPASLVSRTLRCTGWPSRGSPSSWMTCSTRPRTRPSPTSPAGERCTCGSPRRVRPRRRTHCSTRSRSGCASGSATTSTARGTSRSRP